MSLSRPAKFVVINADDFGVSPGVTEGILRAHRDGVVTSTSVMANLPAAEDAVRRLTEVPGLGVGVHLNVVQGPVLSPAAGALADPDGRMDRTAGQLFAAVLRRPRLLDAIEAEFDAQVRWLLDRGRRPTHLDSHRHVHGWGPVFRRVAVVARRYDVPVVRRLREALPGGGWPAAAPRQRLVAGLLNAFAASQAAVAGDLLPARGTWGVAHTGRIDVAWLCRAARALRPGVWEIMTHPGLAEDAGGVSTRLRASRQRELEALCSPAVARAFDRAGIRCVHYGQLDANN